MASRHDLTEGQAAAVEARDAAREMAREAREVMVHRANQVRDVLHPPMVVMAILYPVVIGFTLQLRGWHFSLMHPRPDEGDQTSGSGQWETFTVVVLTRTVGSFLWYLWVHHYWLACLCIRTPNTPRLKCAYNCVAPLIFCFVGCNYFYTYASISRYGAHPSDWIAVGISSGALLMFTLYMLWAPPSTRVIKSLGV